MQLVWRATNLAVVLQSLVYVLVHRVHHLGHHLDHPILDSGVSEGPVPSETQKACAAQVYYAGSH